MKNPTIEIDKIKIGIDHKPYIIAELSANHNGKIDNAYKIIEHAKKCGASAIKIQSYTPETITLNLNHNDFKIDKGPWKGKTLYELYEEAHLPWSWHKPLFEFARKKQITLFSSPFDFSAIDMLEDLNAPAYKIASCEVIDTPLIKYAASTQKPIIISTGMASIEEIEDAVSACFDVGNKKIALLHCVSGYPTPEEDYNLRAILTLRNKFNLVIGLSDHTISNNICLTSLGLGATIFEKHVTLSKDGGGPDDSFSLEPFELTSLCNKLNQCWKSLGNGLKVVQKSEKDSLKFRRSLYFVKKMNKGEKITPDCVRSIRPGYGLPPKHYSEILGRRVTKNINYGDPVNLDIIN